MCLFGQIFYEVFFKAQPHAKGFHFGGSQEFVIKPPASSEACAVFGKGEAWHENQLHIGHSHRGAVGFREEDAIGAWGQVLQGGDEGEGGGMKARGREASMFMYAPKCFKQFRSRHFKGLGGIEGDAAGAVPVG